MPQPAGFYYSLGDVTATDWLTWGDGKTLHFVGGTNETQSTNQIVRAHWPAPTTWSIVLGVRPGDFGDTEASASLAITAELTIGVGRASIMVQRTFSIEAPEVGHATPLLETFELPAQDIQGQVRIAAMIDGYPTDKPIDVEIAMLTAPRVFVPPFPDPGDPRWRR